MVLGALRDRVGGHSWHAGRRSARAKGTSRANGRSPEQGTGTALTVELGGRTGRTTGGRSCRRPRGRTMAPAATATATGTGPPRRAGLSRRRSRAVRPTSGRPQRARDAPAAPVTVWLSDAAHAAGRCVRLPARATRVLAGALPGRPAWAAAGGLPSPAAAAAPRSLWLHGA